MVWQKESAQRLLRFLGAREDYGTGTWSITFFFFHSVLWNRCFRLLPKAHLHAVIRCAEKACWALTVAKPFFFQAELSMKGSSTRKSTAEWLCGNGCAGSGRRTEAESRRWWSTGGAQSALKEWMTSFRDSKNGLLSTPTGRVAHTHFACLFLWWPATAFHLLGSRPS